ncbi:hypothetical protein ACSMXM_16615 [Pacificimonas sp. ICDLI1SI03]|jgi:predicted negative regulator of RcsB-dependent stress response|tara:strand:- start:29457 stop:29582 length:126 start_codon:yes stop_codon:yes gene_type:complete
MWLIVLILVVLIGLSVWFGFQDVPVEQSTMEQEVSADALGL